MAAISEATRARSASSSTKRSARDRARAGVEDDGVTVAREEALLEAVAVASRAGDAEIHAVTIAEDVAEHGPQVVPMLGLRGI